MAAFAAVYSPLPQEGDVAVRRRRIGRQVFRTYPQGYRPAPSRSGKQKEGPFMGRLWVNCARLGNPMQDCRLRKDPALRASCPPSFCYWSDKGAMAFSAFQNKIFEGGCKNGVLMQYKCMEKEIRKLHGRILFPSVMYIANIPAGMQLWQIGSHESLYRLPISLPDFPGPREVGTNSADS